MTTDLSTDLAWNEFFMKFLLGVTLPSGYGGTETPSFASCVMKNGLVEL
jgi:hypothetical protein